LNFQIFSFFCEKNSNLGFLKPFIQPCFNQTPAYTVRQWIRTVYSAAFGNTHFAYPGGMARLS